MTSMALSSVLERLGEMTVGMPRSFVSLVACGPVTGFSGTIDATKDGVNSEIAQNCSSKAIATPAAVWTLPVP